MCVCFIKNFLKCRKVLELQAFYAIMQLAYLKFSKKEILDYE